MLQENFISFSYDVRLRRTLYQSCSTRWDLQLCSLNFFNLRSFEYPNIFIWNNLSNKNYVWFIKFKIWIFQTASDRETSKTKVVDLEKLCNFVVDIFFVWNHSCSVKYGWIFLNLKFKFFKRHRMEKWLEPSCRSWNVIKLCSWQCFHLKPFRVPNTHFKTRWT